MKQAGVVDAGGQGLYVMFQGALSYLRGMEPLEADTDSLGAIDQDWLAQAHSLSDDGETFGYCTELVITGSNLSVEAARGELEAYGRSLLVVGDEHAIHLHVHTKDPGRVLSYASALGPLSRVKVDNMELQHRSSSPANTFTRVRSAWSRSAWARASSGSSGTSARRPLSRAARR